MFGIWGEMIKNNQKVFNFQKLLLRPTGFLDFMKKTPNQSSGNLFFITNSKHFPNFTQDPEPGLAPEFIHLQHLSAASRGCGGPLRPGCGAEAVPAAKQQGQCGPCQPCEGTGSLGL